VTDGPVAGQNVQWHSARAGVAFKVDIWHGGPSWPCVGQGHWLKFKAQGHRMKMFLYRLKVR